MDEQQKQVVEAAVKFLAIMSEWDESHPLYHIIKQASDHITALLDLVGNQQAAIEAANAALSECQKALDIERGGDLPF